MFVWLADLSINLIAAAIGFGVGAAWTWYRQTWQVRGARRFWGRFAAGDVLLVVGRTYEFAGFEPSGFIGSGDVEALSVLTAELSQICSPKTVFADAPGIALSHSMILIGGPDANNLTHEVMKQTPTTFRLGDPVQHVVSIWDSERDEEYRPSRDGLRDYGLIVSRASPFDPGHRVIVIAGSFGFGTWAAALTLAGPELRKPLARGGDFECLIRTDVVLGRPSNILIEEVRSLAAASGS